MLAMGIGEKGRHGACLLWEVIMQETEEAPDRVGPLDEEIDGPTSAIGQLDRGIRLQGASASGRGLSVGVDSRPVGIQTATAGPVAEPASPSRLRLPPPGPRSWQTPSAAHPAGLQVDSNCGSRLPSSPGCLASSDRWATRTGSGRCSRWSPSARRSANPKRTRRQTRSARANSGGRREMSLQVHTTNTSERWSASHVRNVPNRRAETPLSVAPELRDTAEGFFDLVDHEHTGRHGVGDS